MDKVTIHRTGNQEDGYYWYKWDCSCGERQRYLNSTARDLGSESHAEKHTGKSKK